ncbi:MAG: VTT domain-containing protein [Gemmatimonadota bacterium]
MSENSIARRVWAFLIRRRGNALWDWVVRGTGVLGLVGIPLVLYAPRTGPLVAFVMTTIWVNGPISPIMPATYEPVLMLFGRVYPPPLIASLGALGILYVEFLTYQMYRKLLGLDQLRQARESRLTHSVVRLFRRAPFFSVWLCALTPLPFWAVQILSPLSGYPVQRHLLATLLGRFPRLWLLAALGLWWQVPASYLIGGAGIASLLAIGIGAGRHWQSRRGTRGPEGSAGGAEGAPAPSPWAVAEEPTPPG